jgi:hypothetical protein
MENSRFIAEKCYRFGEFREFFEGIAQQDEGEYFKLFADRAGKRAGQGEDQVLIRKLCGLIFSNYLRRQSSFCTLFWQA